MVSWDHVRGPQGQPVSVAESRAGRGRQLSAWAGLWQQRSLDFEQWEPLEGFRQWGRSDQIVTVKVSSGFFSRGPGSWEWKDGEAAWEAAGLPVHIHLISSFSTEHCPPTLCADPLDLRFPPSASLLVGEGPQEGERREAIIPSARMAQWSRA